MVNYVEIVVSILLLLSLTANAILWVRIQQLNSDMREVESRMTITDGELDSLASRLDEIKKLTLR